MALRFTPRLIVCPSVGSVKITALRPTAEEAIVALRQGTQEIFDLLKERDAVEDLKGLLAENSHWISRGCSSKAKRASEIKRLYENCAKSATRNGREKCLGCCLKTGLVDPNLCTANGNPMLHLAAHHGNTEVCKLLLAQGADVETRNPYGESAWETANKEGHEECACVITDWRQQQNEQPQLKAVEELSLAVYRQEKEQEYQKMLKCAVPEPRDWKPMLSTHTDALHTH